jgi:hypothetical protein
MVNRVTPDIVAALEELGFDVGSCLGVSEARLDASSTQTTRTSPKPAASAAYRFTPATLAVAAVVLPPDTPPNKQELARSVRTPYA